MTQAVCHSIQNNIFQKGQSLAHQDFIKSVLITLLDYFSRISDMNATIPKNGTNVSQKSQFITTKVRQAPFLEYLYSNEFLLSPVNSRITAVVVESITSYIMKLMSI